MTPPTARTWARRGHTPVIRVHGRPQRRISIAALACYKYGERTRLIYRPKRHADHKRGGRRSFTWTDYRDLLIDAHQQLDAPIVLVRDNLNVHKDRRMRQFIDTHDWIGCYFLPAYAPDLNPSRASGHHCDAAARPTPLHRPRPLHAHAPARSPPDPVPQQPHRRMPRRNRPHLDDTTAATSVTGARNATSTPSRVPMKGLPNMTTTRRVERSTSPPSRYPATTTRRAATS